MNPFTSHFCCHHRSPNHHLLSLAYCGNGMPCLCLSGPRHLQPTARVTFKNISRYCFSSPTSSTGSPNSIAQPQTLYDLHHCSPVHQNAGPLPGSWASERRSFLYMPLPLPGCPYWVLTRVLSKGQESISEYTCTHHSLLLHSFISFIILITA